MVRFLLRAVAMAAIAFSSALAQAARADPCVATERPAFDVVSVRPAPANSNFSLNRTADGLTTTSPLLQLIGYAFNLRSFQITGGPDWLAGKSWKIEGKTDTPDADPSKLDDAQRQASWNKQMQQLQAVLVDRFHFRCHMETKDMPVYELVVAKGGSKLKASTSEAAKRGNTWLSGHAGTMHATGAGVGADRIAILLGSSLDRLVVDKTGLTDSYDFTLDWTSATGAGEPATDSEIPGGPSLFTAVEEQLGLRLQPARGPVPVMVIDRLDLPEEN